MISLENAHIDLHWPPPDEIINPLGSGPSVYARLAKEKIGQAISRLSDGDGIKVGVLTGDPLSNTTESPIAIVCETSRTLSQNTLRQIHKLAWNFSRSPLLIIIEPNIVRAWTCCEPPLREDALEQRGPEIMQVSSLTEQAAKALDWVQLASGQFFKNHSDRFRREQCADYALLETLDYVRQELIYHAKYRLDEDICHDLLARVIFMQFLFHRKDSSGLPALNEKRLSRLYDEGVLSAKYNGLSEILNNYVDSYAFFRWLNEKFNGDLFPGKGETEDEREAEWQQEMKSVKREHLELLSNFVSGHMRKGQIALWPMYSFDAIPLEFISNIYEQFVGKKPGVVYTRAHVVDFILDGVLPWNSKQWDLKILDPSCGSGIFLVKAYQRLIHRWKLAHGEEPKVDDLRGLLENNLLGIDNDQHAVRVASFSLYLAMCDEIDPKHYWNKVKFPRLRHRRIICADFFREDTKEFRTVDDAHTFDIVVGNPPWGRNSCLKSDHVLKWAAGAHEKDCSKERTGQYGWVTAYRDIGPLFLAKAAALTHPEGQIALIQPAMSLIFDRVGTASKFRKKFFNSFKVEEIINLSALRFGLFKNATSPVCIVTMKPTPPDGEPLTYICPKPAHTGEDDYRIIIEPQDINPIYLHEAAEDPLVWTALMWGGRRDFVLLCRLRQCKNLEQLKAKKIAVTRQGIVRGDRKKFQQSIHRKPILNSDEFLKEAFIYLNAKALPENDDPYTHSRDSVNFDAFTLPQLIIKQAWSKNRGRFQAVIIASDETTGGIVCSESYESVHINKQNYPILETAWLSYNSKLAVYSLLLSSGSFAAYRPTINVEDLLRVPIPEPQIGGLNRIKQLADVDEHIRKAFSFKESEWTLIDDLFEYTLPDFKGDISSPGRQKTRTSDDKSELHLKTYCEYFLKVLKAGFGKNKSVGTTILQEKNTSTLPLRMVAIHLDWPEQNKVRIESFDAPDLTKRLFELNQKFLKTSSSGGIFYQRVVRVYSSVKINGKKIPTIFIIKPDQIRYWTRSLAMRDADEVATDIMMWRQSTEREMDS